MAKILVIVGSTRPRRISPKVADWVAQVGRDTILASIEIVDLKDWPLPMDDEPGLPALGRYAFDHTHAWSRKIAEGDAIVFVTPQYNWGYPAPLKNALDHLHKEWAGKPAMIVTYGSRGGNKCSRQLRQVLNGLDMKTVAIAPRLKLSRKRIEANEGTIEPAAELSSHRKTLRRGFAQLGITLESGRVPKRLGIW
jgi:NAD(P)H-dependent FMN reductase